MPGSPTSPVSPPVSTPAYSATPFVDKMATAQHFVPPSARELRAQAVQRLQVGLFGLAAMLLLVGLANIIMQHARQSDANSPAARAASSNAGNSDPLADIGVEPSPEPGAPPPRRPANGAPTR